MWTKNSRYKSSLWHPVLTMANAMNRLPFTQLEDGAEMEDIEKIAGKAQSIARPESAATAEGRCQKARYRDYGATTRAKLYLR